MPASRQRRRFHAVHPGHLDVHQDQIVAFVGCHFYGFFAVDRGIGLQADTAQQFERDFLIDRVVFDKQDERLAVFVSDQAFGVGGGKARDGRIGRVRADLQACRKPESTALTDGTRYAGFAAHQDGQSLGNGEAESGAAKTSGCRVVGLFEGLEKPALLFGVDADAGIGHGKSHDQVIGFGREQID